MGSGPHHILCMHPIRIHLVPIGRSLPIATRAAGSVLALCFSRHFHCDPLKPLLERCHICVILKGASISVERNFKLFRHLWQFVDPFLTAVLVSLKHFHAGDAKICQSTIPAQQQHPLPMNLHMLDHFPSFRHVSVTLPVSVHSDRNVLTPALPVIHSP